MPAVWGEDEFQSGGLKGITKFVGELDEIEDDVEGKFGMQLALYFSEVEVLESVDEVSLEDGKYTDWIKQSNRTGSVNEAFATNIREFIKDHDLGKSVPDSIYGNRIIWERQTVVEGDEEKKMSPGTCLVPIALEGEEDEKPAKKSKASKSSKSTEKKGRKAKPEPEPEPDEDDDSENESSIPDTLVDFIVETVGEDGATRDLIRRNITKKTPMRKAMTEAGGLETVLDYLVENERLTEEDGTYFQPEED